MSECLAFRWRGPGWDLCARCGDPAWDHDLDIPTDGELSGQPVYRPWGRTLINRWEDTGRITPARADHLRSLHAGNP